MGDALLLLSGFTVIVDALELALEFVGVAVIIIETSENVGSGVVVAIVNRYRVIIK